ncbi:YbaK/aminoacyl-tRNA synthetase-associated domain-containing protein [Strigomonas culicis]|nr:YbaK/aminoacyl-tRNA synthetase-associated domain-containing protein [Strigomonas culicis]EPY36779.1 YbaK/aminoacyl-tRNA synthetase-associated domain-containing protein [Strigomonas culicis]|eukprot:EPY23862.1 YbaK/aminoacyl-tRNA synthetase-associated domain-containing protein [Strigomonas culicis]
MESRVALLCRRYDRIEAALQELAATAAGGGTVAATAASVARPVAVGHDARDTPEVTALRHWCRDHQMATVRFKWVPSDYYTHPLAWRRDVLRAPSMYHICKTIVLENTHCAHEDCQVRENARFYMVVFQYAERFDAERLTAAVRRLNPGIGKKQFNFRVADPQRALELTGFSHGAVVALGTRTPIPVILSDKVAQLAPAYFWMGGGHVDCKLRVDVDEYVRVMEPLVAPVTVPMDPEALEALCDP